MRMFNRYLPVILPFIIILPFCVIAYYNHPALDDWWYAEVFKNHGILGAQQYWYNHYTARFFSNFVMTIAPLSYRWIEAYKVLPIVFFTCIYATAFYTSKTVLSTYPVKKHVLALWFTVTYMLIQRDYFESFYWLSANVVYQYAMLYLLLHVGFMYRIFIEKTANNKIYLLATLSSIAIVGSDESLGGLVLAEAVAIFFISLYQKRLRIFSNVFLCIQVLMWVVMLSAPGNWAKIHEATKDNVYTFSFIKAIGYSFLSMGYYTFFLLKQPAIWFLMLLSIPLWKYIFVKKLHLRNVVNYLLAVILCLCCSLAIYFISIYPTGILVAPLRVTNIAIVFLFFAFALGFTWLSENLNVVQGLIGIIQKNKALVMVAILFFAIITPAKYQQILTDLSSGKAKKYNETMYLRYEKLRSAHGDTCYLDSLRKVPRTIVATDVGPAEVGQHLGLIFDKKNIVIFK